ncbi:MAG: DEAD/DEAH box helicase [Leptolyngbyaceae cyanobacterium bins.349]|nr:DEAD/DEAH box helicase [Leptolyngbyaceae cyanobacterium bins.349]
MPEFQVVWTSPKDSLNETFSYLDLEVDSDEEIYRFGLVTPTGLWDADRTQAEEIRSQLRHICQTNSGLCGHNIRRFDYPHLIRKWAELEPLLVIDTLELSVLAFPLHPSHKLQKDYKLSQYASNNPLEDAQATRFLLQQILQTLAEQPEALQLTYCWLLSCGSEAADCAYQFLFQQLGLQITSPPQLDELPEGEIAQMERGYLEHLWQHPNELNFDDRLSLAALLSWNYARHQTSSRQAPSTWLYHLPRFQTLLDALFPVEPEGFTYQPYFQEFDIPGFRPHQEEAVQAILAEKRPLILMATGGGKSLCYQLPALMYYRRQRGLTVCVSPLQALMEDQVADLDAAGLDFATFINGTLSAEERSQRLEQIRDGWKGLLYISP